jgi:hypothetical protein
LKQGVFWGECSWLASQYKESTFTTISKWIYILFGKFCYYNHWKLIDYYYRSYIKIMYLCCSTSVLFNLSPILLKSQGLNAAAVEDLFYTTYLLSMLYCWKQNWNLWHINNYFCKMYTYKSLYKFKQHFLKWQNFLM